MKQASNPAGKAGKPFTLAPHSFEDALKTILGAKPPEKPTPKPRTKPKAKSRKKAAKKKGKLPAGVVKVRVWG